MAEKTKTKAQVARVPVAETYEEDIEDAREGIDETMAVESDLKEHAVGVEAYETEMEEAEDVEDHEEVSSEETADVIGDVEDSAIGEEAAPQDVSGQDLERLEGFDETILEMSREEVPAQADEGRLLDAWYGEFADESTMAVVRQQPGLTQTTAEVVIGKDDRIQVHNTTAYPWRTICSLVITAKDGSGWRGTGWLVGPGTVMTAGHCVYMHGRGGWVRRIEVIPGRNGSKKPYGSCAATCFCSVKGWTNKKKRSHDYGAIILPSNCRVGNRVGWFGYANLGYASLLGLKVNLSGYPGDKPSGTQWWHARRIKWVTSRTIVYNIDTAGGQSGSPVWRLKNGKRHAVGIHTNGSTSGNSATRIIKPVFQNITKWKQKGSS